MLEEKNKEQLLRQIEEMKMAIEKNLEKEIEKIIKTKEEKIKEIELSVRSDSLEILLKTLENF